MRDQMRVVGGGVIGAIVGGLAAYLLTTDHGRATLRNMSPAVEDLSSVMRDLRAVLVKLGDVAADGRRTAADVLAAFGSHNLAQPRERAH